MLKKTEYKFDLEPLKKLLESVKWDDRNRCNLNQATGHWLYDPYVICEEWKDTAFDSLLHSIPYPIGEARLMKLDSQKCYRAHSDADDRLHINITTNEYSYLINLEENIMHNLYDDGFLYYMDGSKMHTAVNFGPTPRIQLVIRLRLDRNENKNYDKVDLKFIDPPYNLRYLIDRKISPLINQYCKSGEIGFFDLVDSDTLYFEISADAIERIKKMAELLNLKVKIERKKYD